MLWAHENCANWSVGVWQSKAGRWNGLATALATASIADCAHCGRQGLSGPKRGQAPKLVWALCLFLVAGCYNTRGRGVRGQKQVCVPEIDPQFPAPSTIFCLFLRKHFLMWVAQPISRGTNPPPPPYH